MSGYVVVISPDAAGIPHGDTYTLDTDEEILAVVALLKGPKKKQLRVVVDGLHVRGGPGEEFKIIQALAFGDILPALELATDFAGNEWARIAQNQWICRVYDGRVKAEWVQQSTI